MRKILLISCSVILVLAFTVFVLEKTHVINLYQKPAVTTEQTKPVNTVSYVPATSTETDEASQIKQALIDQSNKPVATSSKIDISLSAANQDISGGPLIVRAIVNTSGGSCNLVLTKGSTQKTYTSEVANLGTYNSCKGFDVPIADLESGKWQLKLAVINGQANGEVTQEVNITK